MLKTRDEYLQDAGKLHAAMMRKLTNYIDEIGEIHIPIERAPVFHAMATMILASIDLADSVAEE